MNIHQVGAFVSRENENYRNKTSSQSPHRHVKFCDQSESGYSTNTSGDESWVSMQPHVAPLSPAGDRARRKPGPNEGRRKPAQSRGLDQWTEFASRGRFESSNTMTPSPGLAPYYDPLHLGSLWEESKDEVTRGGSNDSSPKKRGILKKSGLTKSHGDLRSNLHDSSESFFPAHASYVMQANTRMPPHQKSAFTPVAPRKRRISSTGDLASTTTLFTPVKGPAVLDYVTSSELVNDLDKRESPLLYSPQPIHGGVPHFFQCDRTSDSPYNPKETSHLHLPPTARRGIGAMTKDMNLLKIKNGRDSHDSSANETSSVGSDVSQVEVLTNSAVRIRHFLEKTSAKDLKTFITEQLDSKDPEMIKALSTIIPVRVAEQVESHCVRCHKNFDPNERSRCHMPHPQAMVEKLHQDGEGANFVCHCCSTGFRLIKMDFYEESTNALLTGHCYSGQHTTDPESVDYRSEGGAAKSCAENGCVEFYV